MSMADSKEKVQAIVTAAGALAEATALIYHKLLDAGFDAQQAFALATDYFNSLLPNSTRSKPVTPEE